MLEFTLVILAFKLGLVAMHTQLFSHVNIKKFNGVKSGERGCQ